MSNVLVVGLEKDFCFVPTASYKFEISDVGSGPVNSACVIGAQFLLFWHRLP